MDESEYLWDKRHEVIYLAELSSLYHQKRERFFFLLERTCNAIGVVGGSAALASLPHNAELMPWIAMGITITSALSLVLGFSERAHLHADLSKDFRLLKANIVRYGERDFTEEQVANWKSELSLLDSKEPPALGGLVVICQNELARAQGHLDHVAPVSRWQKIAAHFFDIQITPSTPQVSQ